jgi:uncharacterized protein
VRDVPYLLARRLFKLRHTNIDRVERRKDLEATMADGAVLLADHYVPDGDTSAPLVLIRSPYGRRGAFGLIARTLAYEGFQVIMQSCRGTDGSGGRYDRPFRAEPDDGRDTVAWLRRQAFYPGRFATFSGSYLGYVQLALPLEAKTDLFGAVLQIAPSSTRDVVWPQGGLALATSLGWSAGANRNDVTLRGAFAGRRDRKNVLAAGMSAPLIHHYTTATKTRVGFLEDWWTHPDADDRFWDDEDQRNSLDTYDCPVLVQSGWFDLFLESSIDQYERLAARRTDARLTVGPWTHATFTRATRLLLAEAADFLHAAHGDIPALTMSPVRLLEARSGAERRLEAWPPPHDAEDHLLSGSGLHRDVADHHGARTSFMYDPNSPTPQVGGALLDPGGGPVGNAELERRDDVITFDTPVFTEAVDYIGAPTVDLWVTADVPAPQLFVRLNVVTADGTSTNITDTLIGASGIAAVGPTLLTATLPPTCVRVEAGERLRLLVAGGAFPRYARSPGTGESAVTAVEFRVAHIDVHHDTDHPSRLTLPRLAASMANAE